jgi:hypothetical protein
MRPKRISGSNLFLDTRATSRPEVIQNAKSQVQTVRKGDNEIKGRDGEIPKTRRCFWVFVLIALSFIIAISPVLTLLILNFELQF